MLALEIYLLVVPIATKVDSVLILRTAKTGRTILTLE